MWEEIQFAVARAIPTIICNPEFWMFQYVPVLIGIFN